MKEEQLYWQNLRHLVLKKRRRRYMAPNCTGMVSDKWERGSVTYHVHILFVQATETENETFPWWLLVERTDTAPFTQTKRGGGKDDSPVVFPLRQLCNVCSTSLYWCKRSSLPHCFVKDFTLVRKKSKFWAKFAVISRLQATTLPPLECHIVPARKRPSWQEWTLWAKWWLHVEGNVISYLILVCVYIPLSS